MVQLVSALAQRYDTSRQGGRCMFKSSTREGLAKSFIWSWAASSTKRSCAKLIVTVMATYISTIDCLNSLNQFQQIDRFMHLACGGTWFHYFNFYSHLQKQILMDLNMYILARGPKFHWLGVTIWDLSSLLWFYPLWIHLLEVPTSSIKMCMSVCQLGHRNFTNVAAAEVATSLYKDFLWLLSLLSTE